MNNLRNYLRKKKYFLKIILRAYNFNLSKKNILKPGSIVFISDNIIWSGGLVDRLKGVISLYEYAKKNQIKFYIFSNVEDDFYKYFIIKDKSIVLDSLDRNILISKIYFFIDDMKIKSYNNKFSKNKINHVYTNLDLIINKSSSDLFYKWRFIFYSLFEPSKYIKQKVDYIINDKKYIVFAFRFSSRMGDFEDDGKLWDEKTKIREVAIIIKAVKKKIEENYDKMVYIASDSEVFLKQLIKRCPKNIFYNPITKASMINIERSIIELLVISKSDAVFQFKRPTMYHGAFSQYAAIIGNIDYNLVEI